MINNSMYNERKIAERIKKERKKMKYSQEELCELLDIDARQTIGKWEKGESYPTLDNIIKMCNIFNCDIDYLLGKDDDNCRTRENTDIKKATGLSERAINTIKYSSIFRDLVNYIAKIDDDMYCEANLFTAISEFVHMEDNPKLEAQQMYEIQQYLNNIKQYAKDKEKETGVRLF